MAEGERGAFCAVKPPQYGKEKGEEKPGEQVRLLSKDT
jgi:hypothetical protein